MSDDLPADKNAIIEEYANIRAEILILFYAVIPWFKGDSTIIAWFKVVNGIIILIILGIQYYTMKKMVDYKIIKKAMKEVYRETSLRS